MSALLLLVCVSLTIIGQPRNRVFIRRVRDKPPFSFVRGQDSTMSDIIWVSPQGHRSVSVSRHFLLQAPQWPCLHCTHNNIGTVSPTVDTSARLPLFSARLPSHTVPLALGKYHIILFGYRSTYVNNLPRVITQEHYGRKSNTEVRDHNHYTTPHTSLSSELDSNSAAAS